MAVILLNACVNVAALMLGQVDRRETELEVRSAGRGAAAALARAPGRGARAIRELTTMQKVFTRAIGPARQVMTLLTLLTLLSGPALVPGVVGAYGVVSHCPSEPRLGGTDRAGHAARARLTGAEPGRTRPNRAAEGRPGPLAR